MVLDPYLELSKITMGVLYHRWDRERTELLANFRNDYLKLVPMGKHLSSPQHSFGYIFGLPHLSDMPEGYYSLLHKFCCLDQITFQLNFSFGIEKGKRNFYIDKFAGEFLAEGVLGRYLKSWFALWRELLENGLTELIDYYVIKDEPTIIERKIKILKLANYCNPELLNRVDNIITLYLTRSSD